MADPQAGIFARDTRAHWFLHYRVDTGVESSELCRAIAAVRRAARENDVEVVVGFGRRLARSLLGDGAPEGLKDFEPISGTHSDAVATQEDLFLWLHGTRHDVNLEVARESRRSLRGVASLARETPAWVHLDSRDLTGFIDGTANPSAEDAPGIALLPDRARGAGGSYVLVQRFVHDLDAFEALPVDEQEAVIGRSKAESREIADRPASSHISRAEFERDGEEQEIFRRSVAYGGVEEAGLVFLAFSRDLTIFEGMLARIYGTAGDGVADRLTCYTRAVTGAFYFAPSEDALAGIGI